MGIAPIFFGFLTLMRALREARPGGLDGFLPCVASGLRHDKKRD